MSQHNIRQYGRPVEELNVEPAKAYFQDPTYVNKVDEIEDDRFLHVRPAHSVGFQACSITGPQADRTVAPLCQSHPGAGPASTWPSSSPGDRQAQQCV